MNQAECRDGFRRAVEKNEVESDWLRADANSTSRRSTPLESV